MAHTALHFSVGLTLGMAAALPAVLRALAPSAPSEATGRACTRWVALPWTLAALAVIPNLCRYVGLPEAFCDGWWMNLCLFHPLIDRATHGGTLIGGLVLVAGLATQYGVLLAALAAKRWRTQSNRG